MIERDEALKLANKILDRPGVIPADDYAVLAREYMRERDSTYLIWSNPNQGWLKPIIGYSPKLTEAGGYSRSAAMGICAAAITGAMRTGDMIVSELPVRLADVQEFIKGRASQ